LLSTKNAPLLVGVYISMVTIPLSFPQGT